MNGFYKNQHSVYRLTYHVVFAVKYRKPAITDEIAAFMQEDAARLLELKGGSLTAFNHDKDHVHMLIELPPQAAPSVVVCVLKTQTARNVRARFKEEITPYLWGDAFWSESYFICTTGGATIDVVKRYVENQGVEKEKRKYVKSGKYSKKRRRR